MRWQDRLCHLLSLESSQSTAGRQSRETAWKMVDDQARFACKLPVCLSLSTCDVLLVQWDGQWQPVLVLTCYRRA